MKGLYLIMAAVPLVALGLVLWFTAWIVWPLALLLTIAGIVLWMRERRRA